MRKMIYPDTMDKNLQPAWCNINNEISNDLMGIDRSEIAILDLRDRIEFFKTRIISNTAALEALEGVRRA